MFWGDFVQGDNLGIGHGFPVQEVIDTAQKVSGRSVAVIDSLGRAGDPSRLVADPTLARQKLGWQPQFSELRTLTEHAWRWQTRQT